MNFNSRPIYAGYGDSDDSDRVTKCLSLIIGLDYDTWVVYSPFLSMGNISKTEYAEMLKRYYNRERSDCPNFKIMFIYNCFAQYPNIELYYVVNDYSSRENPTDILKEILLTMPERYPSCCRVPILLPKKVNGLIPTRINIDTVELYMYSYPLNKTIINHLKRAQHHCCVGNMRARIRIHITQLVALQA